MSKYSPLTDGEAPPVPSLDQLRNNKEVPSMVELQEKKNAEQQQNSAVMVESYVVQAAPQPAASQSRDRWIVKSCCCGCSLSAGVYWIAALETVSYIFALFFAAVAIYMKTQENKIDHAIMKEGEDETEESSSADASSSTDGDEMSPEDRVKSVNQFIDMAAYTSPFVILLSLIGLFFCYQGFKAVKGDAKAAHLYYQWKKFAIFWAFVQMIFGGGFGGFIGFLLAIYYCMVVRSYWLELTSEVAQPADSVTVTTITQVSPNMV